MENLTHSLVGAALAELALPANADRSQRRLFFTVGVLAANLPDADLLYTRITPPPLGYLLHHRGHTHTLVGVAAQALVFGLIYAMPAIRRRVGSARGRFAGLVVLALLSHLVLDSWNEYGVHPFYPFDDRWIYGDAVAIFEPWLWAVLGVAAVANTRNRVGRGALAALLVVAVAGITRFGMIAHGISAALVVGAAALSLLAIRLTPRKRSAAAIALTSIFVATMFGLSRTADAKVRAAFPPAAGGRLIDVVLSPTPADPRTWTFLTIEADDAAGEYAMRRGAVSLDGRGIHSGSTEVRQSIGKLRQLSRDDCWARAWLQFGRAPATRGDAIVDLRFGTIDRGNFTEMPLRPRENCPPHLTNWSMPRPDLVAPIVRSKATLSAELVRLVHR